MNVLLVTSAPQSGQRTFSAPGLPDAVVDVVDIYDFPDVDLSQYSGLITGLYCDMRVLESMGDQIAEWVRAGGRIITNGHPVLRWLPGMPAYRKMEFHTLTDLWLHAVEPHPVWEGVNRADMVYHCHLPLPHTPEQLREVGVAGFYGHAYLASLPEGARVITGVGPNALPVDVTYPLGKGEVIVHCGNDITGFGKPQTSAEGLVVTLINYLGETR